MSNRGRDYAIQLVGIEESIDFTKHALPSSAHEHEQKDSANERIVIVTDNSLSAVNCPIKVEIVPLSWFPLRALLIYNAYTAVSRTRTERQRKRDN